MLDQTTISPSHHQTFPPKKLSAESILTAEVNAHTHLPKYVNVIAKIGLLFGKIRTLKLRYGPGGVTNVYDVKDVGYVSFTVHLCSMYGRGPKLEITQRMDAHMNGIEYADTPDCLPRNGTRPIEPNGWEINSVVESAAILTNLKLQDCVKKMM